MVRFFFLIRQFFPALRCDFVQLSCWKMGIFLCNFLSMIFEKQQIAWRRRIWRENIYIFSRLLLLINLFTLLRLTQMSFLVFTFSFKIYLIFMLNIFLSDILLLILKQCINTILRSQLSTVFIDHCVEINEANFWEHLSHLVQHCG